MDLESSASLQNKILPRTSIWGPDGFSLCIKVAWRRGDPSIRLLASTPLVTGLPARYDAYPVPELPSGSKRVMLTFYRLELRLTRHVEPPSSGCTMAGRRTNVRDYLR